MGGPFGSPLENITCDVAVIGRGAGTGITAERLTKAGLQVVFIEACPLKSSSDFNQKESEAYPPRFTSKARSAKPKTRSSIFCRTAVSAAPRR